MEYAFHWITQELSEKAAMREVKQGACHQRKWRKCMFLFILAIDGLSGLFVRGACPARLHPVFFLTFATSVAHPPSSRISLAAIGSDSSGHHHETVNRPDPGRAHECRQRLRRQHADGHARRDRCARPEAQLRRALRKAGEGEEADG